MAGGAYAGSLRSSRIADRLPNQHIPNSCALIVSARPTASVRSVHLNERENFGRAVLAFAALLLVLIGLINVGFWLVHANAASSERQIIAVLTAHSVDENGPYYTYQFVVDGTKYVGSFDVLTAASAGSFGPRDQSRADTYLFISTRIIHRSTARWNSAQKVRTIYGARSYA